MTYQIVYRDLGTLGRNDGVEQTRTVEADTAEDAIERFANGYGAPVVIVTVTEVQS